MIYRYYPRLSQLERTAPKKDVYDILFLGASVAGTRENGGVQKVLLDTLTRQTGRKIRIYNLTAPGDSSLDSYYKYKKIINRKFDLVLIYHAINDTRANNCPPEMFKEDYSHYALYEELALLDLHQEINLLVSPYLLHRIAVRVWTYANHIEYVPWIFPRGEWVRYGADIKTRSPFRNNLEKILTIARQKGEKVLLMTFAYYVPEGYSFEKFKRKELPYTFLGYSAPIEEWGDPVNVVKGIEAHNEVIKALADEHKEVLYVDQARLIPSSGDYYRDICHFTPAGFEKFVGNISGIIIKNMPSIRAQGGFPRG